MIHDGDVLMLLFDASLSGRSGSVWHKLYHTCMEYCIHTMSWGPHNLSWTNWICFSVGSMLSVCNDDVMIQKMAVLVFAAVKTWNQFNSFAKGMYEKYTFQIQSCRVPDGVGYRASSNVFCLPAVGEWVATEIDCEDFKHVLKCWKTQL